MKSKLNMKSKQSLLIWLRQDSAGLQSQQVTSPVWLGSAGLVQAGYLEAPSNSVLLQPANHVGAVGLLMFSCDSTHVLLNGLPIAVGAHAVRHGDRIDVGDQTFWVSVDSHAEEVGYDPAIHGDDVFCFLTKARIVAGQMIKICPGTPGTSCGVIYKSDAWDMAFRSDTPMKCPNCGNSSERGRWQPPEQKTKRSLDGIFQLINNSQR